MARTKASPYEMRTPVVQILSARGYTREEIAIWIRDNINDDDDNLNPVTMTDQVSYWYLRDDLAKCSSYDNPDFHTNCCPNPCGRSSPLEDESMAKRILQIPDEDYRHIWAILDDIRKRGVNAQLFKTTRSKVTTSLVLHALENNYRITVIEPTTKIIETIRTAMKIFAEKHGIDKYAATLPDHREGCLILKLQIEEAVDLFPGERPGLIKLPFVNKPDCNDCKFQYNFVDFPPGDILHESDTTNFKCQYTTAMHFMDKVDVLMLTNKKLNALVRAAEIMATNQFVENTDAVAVLDWIAASEVVVLDEISMYTDVPEIAVLLQRIPIDDDRPIYDLTKVLEYQADQIKEFRDDQVAEDIRDIIDDMVKEFRTLQKKDGITNYTRVAVDEEVFTIGKYLKRIQTFARKNNIALTELFEALMISQEMDWIIVEEPDPEYVRVQSIYIAPKFADVCSEFLKGTNCRIIATDATMPLVSISEVLDCEFEKINVGDPEATAEMMRMIPYNIRIASPDITRKAIKEELKRFLDAAVILFPIEDFVCSTPNSKETYRVVKKQMGHDLDVMWFRSSESLGVSNDKRIMLGITSPYCPKDAHNWKKEILYPELLADVSNLDMWLYDMFKTLFQTMSRVKDPHSWERSGYVGFGQTRQELAAMAANCVNPPAMIDITHTHDKRFRPIIPLLVLKFWMEHGVELKKEEQIVAAHIWFGDVDESRKVKNKVDVKTYTWLEGNIASWKPLKGVVKNLGEP